MGRIQKVALIGAFIFSCCYLTYRAAIAESKYGNAAYPISISASGDAAEAKGRVERLERRVEDLESQVQTLERHDRERGPIVQ